MPPPQSLLPGELTSAVLQKHAYTAHENLGTFHSDRGFKAGDGGHAGEVFHPSGVPGDEGGLRPLVRDSWERSLRHLDSPEAASSPLVWDQDELEEYRRNHPLAAVMSVIQQLLVRPSQDTGLLVAVGDEHGRLLWVEGEPALRSRAERISFVSGADWSEASVGTSAPGTALALGNSVQIAGAEHFSRTVHPWSCTAVPVHDPDSGSVLGVVDITGGSEAVGVHTLSLVEAAVAAAQGQLRIQRLQSLTGGHPDARRPAHQIPRPAQRNLYRDNLQILGRDQAVLNVSGTAVPLSERHAEIVTLLALHPQGLSAEQLATMVYPEHASVTTVRAEMVRLRRLLHRHGGELVPASRPYRLPRELLVDAQQVLNYLRRGAHRLALNAYRGEVLPRSEAPAILELRRRVGGLLREAILTDASPEVLLQYLQLPEAHDDGEAWLSALRLLPSRSPRRPAVVAHLERLEAAMP
jgi:transcriptional regulator of acetoin/glycerol metabolism